MTPAALTSSHQFWQMKASVTPSTPSVPRNCSKVTREWFMEKEKTLLHIKEHLQKAETKVAWILLHLVRYIVKYYVADWHYTFQLLFLSFFVIQSFLSSFLAPFSVLISLRTSTVGAAQTATFWDTAQNMIKISSIISTETAASFISVTGFLSPSFFLFISVLHLFFIVAQFLPACTWTEPQNFSTANTKS
jgi:hypothetical protein